MPHPSFASQAGNLRELSNAVARAEYVSKIANMINQRTQMTFRICITQLAF